MFFRIKGRNEDIETKNMAKQYDYLKKQADCNRERLDKKITKNNFIINEEEITVINNYIENIDKNVSDIKNINDLTSLMENFEENLKNHDKEVNKLQLKVKKQAQRIKTLESQSIKKQDKIAEQREEINDLEQEISRLEKIIQMWQQLWQRIREFFQD